MVELVINENTIELPEGLKVRYTKQIADIFNIATVACGYTNSFTFDKTPSNSQAMRQLGISGDQSPIPYIKNDATLKVDGFDVIKKGWFNVAETSDRYSGGIIDGMIDFFKAIENKTLGTDLDLSNFEHEKTMDNIMNSFTNDYYNYIVGDYGGKTLINDSGTQKINIDYLAPSFSVRKLWELIFTTFGFNFIDENLEYLDGLYITYPKDIFEDKTLTTVATLIKNAVTSNPSYNFTTGGIAIPEGDYFWDSSTITEGSLISNWTYVISETGVYNLNLQTQFYALYYRLASVEQPLDVTVNVYKNGVLVGNIESDYTPGDHVGDIRTLDIDVSCTEGDRISIAVFAPVKVDINGRLFAIIKFVNTLTEFVISKTNLGTTKLRNELRDFQIKDFFKEIIWRTGLTPVYYKDTNNLFFIKLNSRLDFNNSQDLSHCFVERKSEIYTNDYAQKNAFKLKRDNDTTDGDGYLYVPNKNITDEKVLAQSKIYAPDKNILTEFIGFSTNQYKIWQAEAKKDSDDNTVVEYKGLTGRFYFIRKAEIQGTFNFKSDFSGITDSATNIPYVINNNTLFDEAVYVNYPEYQQVLNNFRIHKISLALTINDFLGLDLRRPVYFRQENAYYICNSISFEEGKTCEGDFIKINKI